MFTFPQSVGIAGGRPSSSYYFVASQATSLFYLDPHLTRPAVPLEVPPAPAPAPFTSSADDTEDPVLVERHGPAPRISPDHVPYTIDVVDVDDLSDDSETSVSPSNRPRHRSSPPATARVRDFATVTPPPRSTGPPRRPSAPADPFGGSQSPGLEANPTQSRSASPGSSRVSVDPQTLWYANAYTETQLHTFHCEKVKKMPLSGLDPSMLLGFLVRDEADFEDFCERVGKVGQSGCIFRQVTLTWSQLPQKIFTVQDEPPSWDDNDEAGLESVSEPDLDDLAAGEMSADDDMDDGNTTVDAIPTSYTVPRLDAVQPNSDDRKADGEWDRTSIPVSSASGRCGGDEVEDRVVDTAWTGGGGVAEWGERTLGCCVWDLQRLFTPSGACKGSKSF